MTNITITMCKDSLCQHYSTCYRAQAVPEQYQMYFTKSPREGETCRLYAPVYFTNGLVALRENER